ncbi:hypothetical protein [uncultured Nostoc sp.]|uniref:hypothetical protein n=1 Tax=uncultured Nostoc sp. TaxID=340711 RepID=UPI0035C9F67B
MEFRDKNTKLEALNSNVRDPKVNDGEWKAMVYSFNSELPALNCNIRDSRVNYGE